MVEFLRRLSPRSVGRFLNTMDARAVRSLAVSVILVLAVMVAFLFGQRWLQLEDQSALVDLLKRVEASPFAVPAVIAAFVVLALTGFPQILLITATVLVFGGRNGAIYSWLATMISATVTFGLGHVFGAGWVRRYGGDIAQSTVDFLRRHAILASGLIRVIPSGPFIVVNAAAGAARMPLWKYWTGTSVGIVPKILLVVALESLAPDHRTLEGGLAGVARYFAAAGPREIGFFAAVIGGWFAIILAARAAYSAMRRRDAGGE